MQHCRVSVVRSSDWVLPVFIQQGFTLEWIIQCCSSFPAVLITSKMRYLVGLVSIDTRVETVFFLIMCYDTVTTTVSHTTHIHTLTLHCTLYEQPVVLHCCCVPCTHFLKVVMSSLNATKSDGYYIPPDYKFRSIQKIVIPQSIQQIQGS